MVRIRGVLMLVFEGSVTVAVGVLADNWRIVGMIVVTVVVAMGVLMLDSGMAVAMGMPLGGMEENTAGEQRRRCKRQKASLSVAEREGEARAEERTDREDRRGAGCAEPPLRQ